MWWSIYVVVEEGEWQARDERLHPEADLAQLYGHRVGVHPVDAAPDDVAQGLAGGLGRGLAVPGTDSGEALGDAVRGGDEEVAAAARRVADLEV